jgi:hypothetical protein
MKESIEKLEQEMHGKYERIAQFQKKNAVLQERINKLKVRLRGKGLL